MENTTDTTQIKNNNNSYLSYDGDEENTTPNIVKCSSLSKSKLSLEIEPFNYDISVESLQNEASSKNEKNSKSNDLQDLLKARRCEYARNQMKKYRLKLKSDPVRYSAYLENERARNRKRRERKILELMNSGKTLEEARKTWKHKNFTNEPTTKKQNLENKIDITENGCNNKLINVEQDNIQANDNGKLYQDAITKTEIEEEADWFSSETNPSDESDNIVEDIKYNRICGVVTCPSRLNQTLGVHYYPIPIEKNMRDIWFKLIKYKTKQSEIDPDSFICSLHFAPEWFEFDEIYNQDRLLPIAVPTLFPESQIYSQFNAKIPELFQTDFNNPEVFKYYYEWTVSKIRQYESQLKEQLLIIENLNESKEIQIKRIERLIKATKDYKLSKIRENKERHLQNIFDKINDIEKHLMRC